MKKTHLLTLALVLGLVAALLAVPTGVNAGATTVCRGGSTFPTHAAPAETRPAVERLPLPVQYALSRDLGRDNPAYHWTALPTGGYTATNPRTGLDATLAPAGMQVRAGFDTWSLSLTGWGRGEAEVRPAPAAGPGMAQANRLEVARGALTEWYVNGPLGLQQGWTLREPPPGAADAPLTLAGAGGAAQWRYAGLRAYDATGQTLPARLSMDGERVLVQVNDAGATYPLVVDEWVQAAKLTASDGATMDHLGTSVAVSADGGTVVASAPDSDAGGTDRGAVYVYARPEPGWANATQTAKLTASDGADNDWLGSSVAVSADGGTVVASAPNQAAGGVWRGAVYVYTRPETGWATTATFAAKLTASDGADYDWLGDSVAVSADGNTVVAGASGNAAGGSSRGAAYVYARPEPGWVSTTAFTAKLTASDGADNDQLGRSVAVSAEGNTVVASTPYNAAGGTARGAAYVYARPETGWANATQTAKLTASDGADGDQLGWSVVVSADGGTVVASAPNQAAGGTARGAVYVYARPEPGWASTAAFTAKLTASDVADCEGFGWSVAVSAEGNTVVTGAPWHAAGGSSRGAAYVYARPEPGWANATQTAKLTASDGVDYDGFGWSVAVSADGTMVVAGASGNDAGGTDRGAAYAWVSSPPLTPAVYLPLVMHRFP